MYQDEELRLVFLFRPWVRRAGWTIIAVAAGATLSGLVLFFTNAHEAYWLREKSLWIYIAVLWIGGVQIVAGTFRPVAELDEEGVTLRPLHHLRARVVRWSSIVGSEQTVPGDRLILRYETRRGLRFVALNLNLVKGRREFEQAVSHRLRSEGLVDASLPGLKALSRPEPVHS